MSEFLDFLKVFGGFVYLLMGGELLVRGALGLSKEKNISPVVVGMTVVAMVLQHRNLWFLLSLRCLAIRVLRSAMS